MLKQYLLTEREVQAIIGSMQVASPLDGDMLTEDEVRALEEKLGLDEATAKQRRALVDLGYRVKASYLATNVNHGVPRTYRADTEAEAWNIAAADAQSRRS